MTTETGLKPGSALVCPFDGLVSYWFFKSDAAMTEAVGHRRMRTIGDCGAHSAFTNGVEITVDTFAEWALKWRRHLYWIASLDVIGDPTTTYRNWLRIRDVHGLPTVPTVHVGTDMRWLHAYADQGVDFLGLGGGAADKRAFPWLVHAVRYARDHLPHLRFHAWGATNQRVMSALPIYSADSSGTISNAYRFGRTIIWSPTTRQMVPFKLNGREPYKIGKLLRDTYGIEPEQIATSGTHNRQLIVTLLMRSTQLYAEWVRSRFTVTPPKWGINPYEPAPVGPRVHTVLSGDDIQRALGTYKRKM